MPIDDLNSWAQGASALKVAFDAFRSAVGLARDLRGGTPAEQRAIDEALDKASTAAQLAEAEIAKALGYELCKCEFPPIVMKTVGYGRNAKISGAIYECPKCGFNTALGWGFKRIAPPRTAADPNTEASGAPDPKQLLDETPV